MINFIETRDIMYPYTDEDIHDISGLINYHSNLWMPLAIEYERRLEKEEYIERRNKDIIKDAKELLSILED